MSRLDDTTSLLAPAPGPAAEPETRTGLLLSGVSKSFPGVRALQDVDFEVRAGEIHALVGENGAGKSTLMAIAAGVLDPDEGSVAICGSELTGATPAQVRALGLSVVYQHPALMPDLTVTENLVLGVPATARPAIRACRAWAHQRLEAVGADLDPTRRIGDLSVAQRHLVEIAKAFASDPKVLVLDEPTEALNQSEAEQLFDLVRRAAARGVAVVYISHRLRDVERIASRMTVLRDGRSQGTYDVGELTEDQILQLIVGRPVDTAFPDKNAVTNETEALSLLGVGGPGLADLDLDVFRGEVVGLAGIDGNGQRELLRGLAGLSRIHGRVYVAGRLVHLATPKAALAAGIVHMPADRHHEALVLPLSVRENMTLLTLSAHATGGFLRRQRERDTVHRYSRELDLKGNPEAGVATLSGGNQQKVVIARSLAATPDVLLADEPTQGVDAAARLEIYRHLRATAERGAAVLVCSSDAVEHEGLCDRVLVFSRGHVVAELTGSDVTEERITHAAVSATSLRAAADDLPRSTGRWRRFYTGDYAPSALVASLGTGLALYAAARSDAFATGANLENYLLLLTTLSLVALGQFLVVLLGAVDLSVGPLAGLLVALASVVVVQPGTAWAGIALLLAVAATAGVINGLLVRTFRITPVIATLVTFFCLQGVGLLVRPTANGAIDDATSQRLQTSWGNLPVAFLVLLLLVAVLEYRLRFTQWGLELRAAGSSEPAAWRVGVDVDRRHRGTYVSCALLTGLGAFLLMAQIGVGDATAGNEFTLSSIAAVVIGGTSIAGGRGSFLGVLVAAALLQEINNVSTFLHLGSDWQYWLLGGLTLLAAAVYSQARTAR